MPSPLFSTFRAGENRVTSSTLAVFERIDLDLVRELLELSAGLNGALRGVTFTNQPSADTSVPDARIGARFAWWFETKTERGAYTNEGAGRDQVRRHATQLIDDPDAYLFVLTPDGVQPVWFTDLDGVDERARPRVLWFSFLQLATAIKAVLDDEGRVLGEQTRFLLSELRALYEAEGLLSSDDTVVVAARVAWGDYQRYGAYICQPNRRFREGLRYFGFYHRGRIEPTVARIVRWAASVEFSPASAERLEASARPRDRDLGVLIRTVLADRARLRGESYGVMLLTREGDARTLTLPHAIENDTTTDAGRPWAWTLGQRYTSSERLKKGPALTSQL